MKLDKLISFSDNCRPTDIAAPEPYRKQFPFVIFVTNSNFNAFDDCCSRTKLPTVADLMEAAGIDVNDYLLFGQSIAWSWTDNGCVFYYAIALKRPLENNINTYVDLMWMHWLSKNLDKNIRLTDEYHINCFHGCIQHANSNVDTIMAGYFGNPIYPYFVVNSFRDKSGIYYNCYNFGEYITLNKQQLVEWVRTRKVANASIGKTPLKNGDYRVNIKYFNR